MKFTPLTIRFYETDKPYGCFSNFSKHPVSFEGRVWPTSEHCFQATKFTAKVDVDAVHQANTAFLAARVGRERGRSVRTDWDSVRDNAMLAILRAKFTQHASLLSVLASTKCARLIEHTANDSYWADGGDGSGRNRLGELLEQHRDELCADHPNMIAPPWIAFPEFEPLDLFWRMGAGESHIMYAARFRKGLSAAARTEYDAYFPVPLAWRQGW